MAKRRKEEDSMQLSLAAIDALRLDGQSRSVSEAKRIEATAEEFVNGMIRFWGKYIDSTVQKGAKGFPRRVIWTQGKDLEIIYNDFFPDEDTTPHVASKKELREFCIEECGARWYSQDVMGRVGRLSEVMEDDKPIINFYANLIKIHGEKVHRYFFGSLKNEIQISKILRSIDEIDVHNLFGTSYGDMWGEEDMYEPDLYGSMFTEPNIVVLKSGVRIWQEPIRIGHEAPREYDLSGLTAREKFQLSSFDNFNLGHEIGHMFYEAGRSS